MRQYQTWSSRDLSLGLETPFFKVLVVEPLSRLGLEPQFLFLILEFHMMTEVAHSSTYKVLHPLLERILFLHLPPLPQLSTFFSHNGLLMRPNRARLGDKMLFVVKFSSIIAVQQQMVNSADA